MDSFRLEVPITVRFRDIDRMGHVNNAVYFTYCEIARTAYWTKLFGARPCFHHVYGEGMLLVDEKEQARNAAMYGSFIFQFRDRP